jgi:hypothetical protein
MSTEATHPEYMKDKKGALDLLAKHKSLYEETKTDELSVKVFNIIGGEKEKGGNGKVVDENKRLSNVSVESKKRVNIVG